MNSFDAAVLAGTLLFAGMGYRAGLLRSLADILGFIVAVPIAVAVASRFAPSIPNGTNALLGKNSLIVVGLAVLGGFITAQLLRYAVSGVLGSDIDPWDRIAGLFLGVVRATLVAVTVVLVYDRIIPLDREPAFLAGSKARPLLSAAGQHGLRSLPPDITAYVDQLKRESRI